MIAFVEVKIRNCCRALGLEDSVLHRYIWFLETYMLLAKISMGHITTELRSHLSLEYEIDTMP